MSTPNHEVIDLSGDGGVLKKVTRVAEGIPNPKTAGGRPRAPRRPRAGDHVVLEVTGVLSATRAPFDSTLGYPRKFDMPAEVTGVEAEATGLPRGVLMAVRSMRKGEACSVKVRPEYAFGEDGDKTLRVPGGAKVIYDLELIDVIEAGKPVDAEQQAELQEDLELLEQVKAEREEAAARRKALEAEKQREVAHKADRLKALQAKLEAKKKGKGKGKKGKKGKKKRG